MTGEQSPNSDPAALDHVKSVVQRSGTSFFWAMRRLPAEKRGAMYALYAFCREVDDIADEPGDPAGKLAHLEEWRGEIGRLYEGRPGLLVSRALAGAVARFGLVREDFLAIIDGMETDAAPALRIADMDALALYCDRVASAVGRQSNRIFGADDAIGGKIAYSLGNALQLTNILRDLHEDAGLDRIYLPADLLAAHGIEGEDPAAVLAHPRLPEACAAIAAIAGLRFAEARSLLAQCDRRQMRPAIVMMAIYRRIYDKLLRRGWKRLAEPMKLSRAEKLWLALRHGLL